MDIATINVFLPMLEKKTTLETNNGMFLAIQQKLIVQDVTAALVEVRNDCLKVTMLLLFCLMLLI